MLRLAVSVPAPEPVAVLARVLAEVAVPEPAPEPVAVSANVTAPLYERLLAL
jgi:hypothetical protein